MQRLSSLLLTLLASTGLMAQAIEIPDASVRSKYNVSVPVTEPGVLEKFEVQEGDTVQAGDVLAHIDDALITLEKRAAQMEAEAALLRSENDVDQRFAVKSAAVARAEVKRIDRATERYPRSVPESERAQLELQAERAALSLEQADRDREEAGFNAAVRTSQADVLSERLARTVVRSPTSGVVVERFVDAGEWAPVGAPLIRVINLDELRVEAYAPSAVAENLAIGDRAEFEIRGGKVAGQRVPCVISFVSPEINPVDRSVRIFADVDNAAGQLRPGMTGSLRVP